MGDSTANPMDRWVCCGKPMNGNHAHGCVYSRPSWPARTDYGTPSSAGGGETESGWPGAEAGRALGRHIAEEQALGEFGIKASKMAPSQMEAVERMAAELTRLRTALAAAERAGAERAQAIPADQWREDYGPCLWWKDYLGEAPVVGSPLDSDWAEVNDPDEPFTHFTRIPNPVFPPHGAEVGCG